MPGKQYKLVSKPYQHRIGLSNISSYFDPDIHINIKTNVTEVKLTIKHKRNAVVRNILFPENAHFESSIMIKIRHSGNNLWVVNIQTNILDKLFDTAPLIRFLQDIQQQAEFNNRFKTGDIRMIENNWHGLILNDAQMHQFISIIQAHSGDELSKQTFIQNDAAQAIQESIGQLLSADQSNKCLALQ